MTETTEEPKAGEPLKVKAEVTAGGLAFMFLWLGGTPATLSVMRHTIAPGLTWWEVTMPLWGLPVGLLGILTGLLVLTLTMCLIVLAFTAPVVGWIFANDWITARKLAKLEAIAAHAKEHAENKRREK